MKRLIMSASALFAACVLMFSCSKEEPKDTTPVMDTVQTSKKADTTVVLTTDTNAVKVVNTDSLRRDSIERAEKDAKVAATKKKAKIQAPAHNEVKTVQKKPSSDIKMEPNKNTENDGSVKTVKKKP